MTENERRLKAQLDAITAAQSRTQMQVQGLNHRLQGGFQQAPYPQQQYQQEQVIEDDPSFDANNYFPAPQIDPNQLIMQGITQKAAMDAAGMVYGHQQQTQHYQENVKDRMGRLVEDYPALTDEGSDLVNRARAIYQRVAKENPGLDEPTKYELSVREAASVLGARPMTNAPEEDAGWTMGNQHNPSLPSKNTKSRLTPQIIANAQLLGIDVNPKNRVGQANLKELSEYSARFNADRDESHVKYR
jgi:hypothetical protein